MKTTTDARFSFFSAHTTTVSTICFTTAFAYGAYRPDGKYKNLIWASAIALPAVEGYLRVKAGKHFPSDVITGYFVGLGTSYLMHRLHLSKR
jgi:membrane-associated phospholipid phosphatase